MTKVSFRFDEQGRPTGFLCEGHAGFARFGKDIVCSAISALVITTVNSLEELTEDGFTFDANEKKGYFKCLLTQEPSAEAVLLLRSLYLGLCGIAQEYSKHVSLIDWEV